MNKLGFVIKRTNQGVTNSIECNKGQWINKVVDIREYLKLFKGLQGTDNFTTFMSFDESGCYLTLLRAIPGRSGDNLSGWIYIPGTVEISGVELVSVCNYVKNILLESNLENCKGEIESFFSREYPQNEFMVRYSPSSGDLYGVRFIGYYSLPEILDTNRYQPYYSKYKAIFLLDAGGEVTVSPEYKNKFEDLTKIRIEQTCVLQAPTKEDLQFFGRGVRIVGQNNVEFKSSLLVKKGDKIQLYAVRDGFEPFKLPLFEVEDIVQRIPRFSGKVPWQKQICASMFHVKNNKGKQIPNAIIIVEGQNITENDYYFQEEALCNARVVVKANEYEDYSMKINLLNEPFDIQLERRTNEQQHHILLANGCPAEMILKSKHLSSSYSKEESPLVGYSFDFEENLLKPSAWYKRKERLLYGFLGALCTLFIVVAFLSFDAWIDTHHFKLGLPPWEEDNPAQIYQQEEFANEENESLSENTDYSVSESASSNAINYLDNETVWTKTEMEQYPVLRGLYDDMNDFNLSKIINEWSVTLSASIQFQKICELAEKNVRNEWNPKQGKHSPRYNKPDDEQINVTNYINWLDQDQSITESGTRTASNSSKKHTTGGSTSSKHKKNSTDATTKANNGNKNINGGL